MRTLIRFLAFLAVFACGLVLVCSGVALLSAQPPRTGTLREVVERFRAEHGPLPQPTPSALPPEPTPQANLSPPTRVKVQTQSSTELLNGDLFISVPQKSDFSRAVDVTIGSPGWPSKRIDGMRVGDVALYEGKRRVEVRLDASPDYERTEFVVTEKPRPTIDQATEKGTAAPGTVEDFLETLTYAELEAISDSLQTIKDWRQAVASARVSVVMGLVLMVSATVLVAVRPKVRPAPPRATSAAAKPATTQPPSAPVTLDLGPQEAPQSVSATFQTGTGRDGSLWRKVTGLHWRLIQPGWTEQQVRRLLGGPIKVRPTKAQTGEVVSVWHYCTGLISGRTKGTVTFKDGKVVGFAAPPLDYARWVVHTPNPEA